MVPKYLIIGTDTGNYAGQSTPAYLSKNVTKPTTLNGYTPKNKKLLTFPYCYVNLSNNNGTSNSYAYELFNSDDSIPNNQVMFNFKGVPSIGASIKATPYNYKLIDEDNEDEGISGGKYPTLGWSQDAFTNWLTQNAVNIGLGLASNLLSIVGGIATGNPISATGGLISGSMGIASQLGQIYEHSLVPNTAKGNVNVGDINICSDANSFYIYQMSIRQEYAQIIDDYFTRFGYKINRVKLPNINNRPYWNYLEIGSSEEIGVPEKAGKNRSIPTPFWDTINNACRKRCYYLA